MSDGASILVQQPSNTNEADSTRFVGQSFRHAASQDAVWKLTSSLLQKRSTIKAAKTTQDGLKVCKIVGLGKAHSQAAVIAVAIGRELGVIGGVAGLHGYGNWWYSMLHTNLSK